MPRELVAIAPRTPILREFDEPPLRPRPIRIEIAFASAGHGNEVHVNRLTLIAARAASWPPRDASAWDLQRLVDLALAWLASGRVRTTSIVTPIVDFADSARPTAPSTSTPRPRSSWGSRLGRGAKGDERGRRS
jgi:hypothetical protein